MAPIPRRQPKASRDADILVNVRAVSGGTALDRDIDMTIIGHVRTITISHFKAHISEELRRVRKGARLLISDRDTPVAEVVPYHPEPAALRIRAPRVTPFKVPPSTLQIDHDPLEYLLEDRGTR